MKVNVDDKEIVNRWSEGNVLPSYELSWSSPVDSQFCKVNQAFWLVDKVEQLIRLDLEL